MVKSRWAWLLLGVTVAGIGCGVKITAMDVSPLPTDATIPADPGKALVVFMRPPLYGTRVQAPVFEVSEDETKLLGIISARTKFAVQVEPGPHLFMVLGETAEFMSADVAPGKSYFALVLAAMGGWRSRFVFRPVEASKLGTPEFESWYSACRWVEKNTVTERWALENASSIEQKRSDHYPRWHATAEAERPRLRPEDGL
jgi:hypothetical protein